MSCIFGTSEDFGSRLIVFALDFVALPGFCHSRTSRYSSFNIFAENVAFPWALLVLYCTSFSGLRNKFSRINFYLACYTIVSLFFQYGTLWKMLPSCKRTFHVNARPTSLGTFFVPPALLAGCGLAVRPFLEADAVSFWFDARGKFFTMRPQDAQPGRTSGSE